MTRCTPEMCLTCNQGRTCAARQAAAADCSSCNGTCPHPEACHLPERPRASKPTGPNLPRTVAGWARLLIATAAIFGGSLIVGVLGRLTGAL